MKTAVASADKLGQYPGAGKRPGLLPKIYRVGLMHTLQKVPLGREK